MRKPALMAFALGACLTASGCATWASGSAPTADKSGYYVTGQRGNGGAVWLCPSTKTGQDCEIVDVERTN